MRRIFTLFISVLSVAVFCALSGCYTDSDRKDQHSKHPEKGPHGGALIELGQDHTCHAELVHDDKNHKVTIYILGEEKNGKVEDSVAIDAKKVVINLKHDGKAEQFELKADPQENDPDGKSSRFVSDDKELSGDLDHEEGKEGKDHKEDEDHHAELVVVIGDATYRGEIRHHEHDED